MGAYLTIVNNTQDPWQCKIGPDEAALNIATIVLTVVGSAAALVFSAGAAAAPLAGALTASGVVSVFGVSTSALATATAGIAAVSTTASVIGTASSYSITLAGLLAANLEKDGFHQIAPGASHRSKMMTLSLWQQATCEKIVIVNQTTVRVDTLNMRPIFTGATHESTMNHDIQWWINKWGAESNYAVAREGEARMLAGRDEDEDTDTDTKLGMDERQMGNGTEAAISSYVV